MITITVIIIITTLHASLSLALSLVPFLLVEVEVKQSSVSSASLLLIYNAIFSHSDRLASSILEIMDIPAIAFTAPRSTRHNTFLLQPFVLVSQRIHVCEAHSYLDPAAML